MGSRGTALAFLLILVIVCGGAYWAYQAVQGGGSLVSFGGTEVLRPTAIVVATGLPTVTPLAAIPSETPRFVPPTPALLPPMSPTATPLPPIAVATQPPAPTAVALSTPTAPPDVTPTVPPTETAVPTATPAFPFQLALQRPDFDRGCNGHYIYGYIRDSAGNLLPGVLVHVWDQYGNDLGVASSKEAPDLGYYNFPISPVRDTWTVQIVDPSGAALSPPVQVLNTGGFVVGQEACWHQVDWVRG
ncbi:MAG: hypothetical protein M5U01_13565 [Ardenticatenaceae bacterium]|nr:hypothetical protein [Ardenticatenaceae bacterium]HBY98352.1 hypothetical protein [Chloroflexota bacterium]